jgi:DNA-binding transcriptional MerR regulator
MQHEANHLLTNGKMARVLGVDPKTLRKWAGRGLVPSHVNRLNGYRYYFKADVIKALKQQPGNKYLPIDPRQLTR